MLVRLISGFFKVIEEYFHDKKALILFMTNQTLLNSNLKFKAFLIKYDL